MPKKPSEEEFEELIKDIIGVDGDQELTEEQKEKVSELITLLLTKKDESKFKKFMRKLRVILRTFILSFILSLIVFGLLNDSLILDNKWMIFAVAGVISLIITIFLEIINSSYNPFSKAEYLLQFIMSVLLLAVIVLVDQNYYNVYEYSGLWILHILVVLFSLSIIDFLKFKKLFKRG